jgi:site-specific DNA-methyltransferase (adenine-specific)
LAEVVDAGQAAGEIAGHGGGRNFKARPSGVEPATLDELGIDSRRLAEARALRDFLDVDEVEFDGERIVSWSELTKTARAAKAKDAYEERLANFKGETSGATWEARLGDFRDVLAELPDESVDAIVTDPPYPDEFMPLWSDLSKHAARVLKPRGVVIAYTGQIRLPEVLGRMSEHLVYGWSFCLELPGSQDRFTGANVFQGWKPVLVYLKDKWPPHDWGTDVLTSPERSKADYEWEQHAAPVAELLERLVPADGLIVDPFLGVGTFGEATIATGRRFLGVELDEGRHKIACERLAEAAR